MRKLCAKWIIFYQKLQWVNKSEFLNWENTTFACHRNKTATFEEKESNVSDFQVKESGRKDPWFELPLGITS